MPLFGLGLCRYSRPAEVASLLGIVTRTGERGSQIRRDPQSWTLANAERPCGLGGVAISHTPYRGAARHAGTGCVELFADKEDAVLAPRARPGDPLGRVLSRDKPSGIRRHSRIWSYSASGHYPEWR